MKWMSQSVTWENNRSTWKVFVASSIRLKLSLMAFLSTSFSNTRLKVLFADILFNL